MSDTENQIERLSVQAEKLRDGIHWGIAVPACILIVCARLLLRLVLLAEQSVAAQIDDRGTIIERDLKRDGVKWKLDYRRGDATLYRDGLAVVRRRVDRPRDVAAEDALIDSMIAEATGPRS